jgi:hypothetical protein
MAREPRNDDEIQRPLARDPVRDAHPAGRRRIAHGRRCVGAGWGTTGIAWRGPVELGTLLQHCPLELAQLGPWLDADVVDDQPARGVARPERLGLPTAAVQGERALRPQSLTQRVVDGQPIQLEGEGLVVAARQLGVDAVLDRRDTGFAEPGGFGLERRTHGDVDERITPPEADRLSKRCRGREHIVGASQGASTLDHRQEALLVELVGKQVEAVAARDKVETRCVVAVVEQLAQLRHPHLQRVTGPAGLKRRPQLINDAIGADDLAGAEREQGEQTPLLRRPRCYVDAVDDDLQRSQQPDDDPHRPSS